MPGVFSRNLILGAASLVLGAGIFLLALYLFWLADKTPARNISHTTSAHPGMVVVGSADAQHDPLRVTLNGNGQALVRVPLAGNALQDLAFLQLSLPLVPDNGSAAVLWQGASGERLSVPIKRLNRSDSWLYMGGVTGWQGDSPYIEVLLAGPASAYYDVAEIGLFSFTWDRALRSLISDWTVFAPWQPDSINSYWPGRRITVFEYPVPLLVLLLASSVAAYFLLLAVLPGARPFQAAIPVALFLFYWILIDLSWQAKLLRQVDISRELFSGKDSHEKLIAGADSRLYLFAQEVNALVQEIANPRIFVSTRHDYIGMRVSYYLYPNNVFWKRKGPELPKPSLLRRGDFIVLLNPTRIEFDSKNGTLLIPNKGSVKVETVMQQSAGSLLRVI